MANSIILNVDDHEVARYARTRILTSAGYKVYEAGTAAQAFDLATTYKPDMILLDVHLPDLSGLEVSKRLKASMGEETFIIIQITASALLPQHATAALDLGADLYLTEPIDPDVLLATVRSMFRLHHAERSLLHAKRQLEINNKELERSNADLGHFAFAASHDLQEPLRTISIFAEVLKKSAAGKLGPNEFEHLERIVDGAERMRRLITDLLAYATIGENSRVFDVVELRDVASLAVENLRQQILDAGATIEIAEDLPAVLGDFTMLGQVFQNLLSNSLKYRDPSHALLIRITASPMSFARWEIAIEDNGPGIEPEYHELVFRPFKRLHGQKIKGSGIGLAMCRRIIESHGGTIRVESAVGSGAKFLFSLSRA